RGRADCQGVVAGLVAAVATVHDAAGAVHFGDNVFAEIGESIMRGRGGGGVRAFVVATVRQGHVTDAEARKLAQRGEVGVDHVTALDAHQRGNLALLVRGADF